MRLSLSQTYRSTRKCERQITQNLSNSAHGMGSPFGDLLALWALDGRVRS